MNNENLPPNDGVPPTENIPPMDGVPPSVETGTIPPSNALSLYGQEAGVEDFPVLKAFQQYIDAEQSKSRKRMIMLSMFFGVLMTILVAVFVILLGQMNHDKQSANDKLVEFLMREREAALRGTSTQPAAMQPASVSTANDAALKAVTESLAALQKQIADDRAAAAQKARDEEHKKELEAAREAARKAESSRTEKSEAQAELERINREKVDKLRKANALLQAERRKLAAEKEKLRQEKIEEYRRKHYPELYAPVKSASTAIQRPAAPKSATATAIKIEKPKTTEKPKKSDETKSEDKVATSESDLVTADDQPIEYYSSEDGEYKNNELDVEIGL